MSQAEHKSDASTELARERNREAADRTLMAWIRTSLSLIAFGFGIGKLYDFIEASGRGPLDPVRSTVIVGGSFIVLGLLGLLAACIQHIRILRRLNHPNFAYDAMRPIALSVAVVLLLIGAFCLVAVLL
jgi:putative membrane protein